MSPPVLIVGSGSSGLVLALTLLRNGVSVRIIEKDASIPFGQRGAGLMPRTLELYKILDILPEIEAQSVEVPSKQIYTSPEGAKPIKEIPLIELVEERDEHYRSNATCLGQDDHRTILSEIIHRDYGVHIEFSSELVGLSQDNTDDCVIARILKDNAKEPSSHTFSFVVGCDGAHSKVRKEIPGVTFLGETRSENAMVTGDIEVLGGFEGKHIKIWGHNGDKFLSVRPYQKNGRNFYWFGFGGANVDVAKAASSRDVLLQGFYETIGKDYIMFGELKACSAWRANIRMVNKFGEGRVFVVGDAAHVHSPAGGQGMNSGVQDAINLGWKLSLVQRNLAPKTLLDTYTSERLPVIASMLNKTTQMMDKIFTTDQTKVGGASWNRESETLMFGINYRSSSIALDERYKPEAVDPYRSGMDGSVRAGDRAPNAIGAGKKSLFDFFDSVSHTVIVFGPDLGVSEVREAVSRYPAELIRIVVVYPPGVEIASDSDTGVFIDGEGQAYRHYQVEKDRRMVIVVRPDGYIGAVVRDATGMKEYFNCVFL